MIKWFLHNSCLQGWYVRNLKMVVSNIFFDPYLGKWPNLTSIFYKWVVQRQTRKKWWVLNIFCPITEKGCFSFFSNQKNCLSFFSKGLHHFRCQGVKGWNSVALVFPWTSWIFFVAAHKIHEPHFYLPRWIVWVGNHHSWPNRPVPVRLSFLLITWNQTMPCRAQERGCCFFVFFWLIIGGRLKQWFRIRESPPKMREAFRVKNYRKI